MLLDRLPVGRKKAFAVLAPWVMIALVTCLSGCPGDDVGVDGNTDVADATPRPRSTSPGGTVTGEQDGSSPSGLKTPPPGGSGVGGNITGTLSSPTPPPPITGITPTPAPTLAPIVKPVDGGNTLPSSDPLPVPSNPIGKT